MKIATFNIAKERAKNRKDGVYNFREIAYRVRTGIITHVAEGEDILEVWGGCVSKVGSCDFRQDSRMKALRQIG